jgi:hypothetical protein
MLHRWCSFGFEHRRRSHWNARQETNGLIDHRRPLIPEDLHIVINALHILKKLGTPPRSQAQEGSPLPVVDVEIHGRRLIALSPACPSSESADRTRYCSTSRTALPLGGGNDGDRCYAEYVRGWTEQMRGAGRKSMRCQLM